MMAVLDEFIVRYQVKEKNAGALGELQAKQKLFGDSTMCFTGDTIQDVNVVLDKLTKISPEARKILNFLSQIKSNLNTLNLGKLRVVGSNDIGLNSRASHIPTSHNYLPAFDVKNAVIDSANVQKNSDHSVKTSAVALAAGGRFIAYKDFAEKVEGVSPLACKVVGSLAIAAVTLTTAFVTIKKFANKYGEQLQQQFVLGNKIGLSTQQVESHQRTLMLAGKGFLNTKDASKLMEKIGNLGMTSVRDPNPLNQITVALGMAKVNARDKYGDYKGTGTLIRNLSDKLSKMTEDQAQVIGSAIGLTYQEIEILRRNTAAKRKESALTTIQVIQRQRVKESLVALQQSKSELNIDCDKLNTSIGTFFAPLSEEITNVFVKSSKEIFKDVQGSFTSNRGNEHCLSRHYKEALKRARSEQVHKLKDCQIRIKTMQDLDLHSGIISSSSNTLTSTSPGSQQINILYSKGKIQGTQGNHFYDKAIDQAAKKNNVNAAIVKAIIAQESNFNPYARSKTDAMGMMQLMPNILKYYGLTLQEAFNPHKNIEVGTKEIARLLKHYSGDLRLSLMAFNAGQSNIDCYRKHGTLSHNKPLLKKAQNYADALLFKIFPNSYDNSKKLGLSFLTNTNFIERTVKEQVASKLQHLSDKSASKSNLEFQNILGNKTISGIHKTLHSTLNLYQQMKNAQDRLRDMYRKQSLINSTHWEPENRANVKPPQHYSGPSVSSKTVPHFNQTVNIHIDGAHNPNKVSEEIRRHLDENNAQLVAAFATGTLA